MLRNLRSIALASVTPPAKLTTESVVVMVPPMASEWPMRSRPATLTSPATEPLTSRVPAPTVVSPP